MSSGARGDKSVHLEVRVVKLEPFGCPRAATGFPRTIFGVFCDLFAKTRAAWFGSPQGVCTCQHSIRRVELFKDESASMCLVASS